jgi:hypothetical protein
MNVRWTMSGGGYPVLAIFVQFKTVGNMEHKQEETSIQRHGRFKEGFFNNSAKNR